MNSNDAPGRYDDLVYTGERDETPGIAIAEKLGAGGHVMPEQWLRARVRGWMQTENLYQDGAAYGVLSWWLGTYTADGRWVYCSSEQDAYIPKPYRVEYAMRVARHLNLHALPHGGVWFAGWSGGGRTFYLLWKDADGSIQIPIECDKSFMAIKGWTPAVWEAQAMVALDRWREFHRNMDYGKGQQKKNAQGEPLSAGHAMSEPALGV